MTEFFILFYNLSRFPVVAIGVLKWVEQIVSEPAYFEKQIDHTPLHLTLLDEVGKHGLLLLVYLSDT